MNTAEMRLTLNASLRNIVNGENIKVNIDDAVEVFRESAEMADRTLVHARRGRANSSLLSEQLRYDDLSTTGKYRIDRLRKDPFKIIKCIDPPLSIDFWFVRNPNYTDSDAIVETFGSGSNYTDEESGILVRGIALDASRLNGKVRNAHERILGKRARSLKGYDLQRVELILRRGFFKSERCTVYPT